MPGAQHYLLIVQGSFLLLGLTQFEHATQASTLKDRQAQLGPDAETPRIPTAEIRQLHRLKTDIARQANARVEIGFGYTNAGRGGMQLGRGLKDVRATLGQLRRYANGKALLRRRHRGGRQQFGLQAARWFGQ
ncbi:hypothetical protein D3C84_842710 [compost metagenome]